MAGAVGFGVHLTIKTCWTCSALTVRSGKLDLVGKLALGSCNLAKIVVYSSKALQSVRSGSAVRRSSVLILGVCYYITKIYVFQSSVVANLVRESTS